MLATHGLREDPDEEKGIAEETMSEAEASGPLGGCTRSYPLVNIQETMVNQCKSPYITIFLVKSTISWSGGPSWTNLTEIEESSKGVSTPMFKVLDELIVREVANAKGVYIEDK